MDEVGAPIDSPSVCKGILDASSVNTDHIKHIISLMKTVLSQTYFQHEKEIFVQSLTKSFNSN
jgi:hypothetical protein